MQYDVFSSSGGGRWFTLLISNVKLLDYSLIIVIISAWHDVTVVDFDQCTSRCSSRQIVVISTYVNITRYIGWSILDEVTLTIAVSSLVSFLGVRINWTITNRVPYGVSLAVLHQVSRCQYDDFLTNCKAPNEGITTVCFLVALFGLLLLLRTLMALF